MRGNESTTSSEKNARHIVDWIWAEAWPDIRERASLAVVVQTSTGCDIQFLDEKNKRIGSVHLPSAMVPVCVETGTYKMKGRPNV